MLKEKKEMGKEKKNHKKKKILMEYLNLNLRILNGLLMMDNQEIMFKF